MTKHTIKMFLKFGSEHDIYDLYENGTIYMNPIDKFRKMEDNELRGDEYEAASEIWNLPAGRFTIPSISHPVNYLSMHLKGTYEHTLGNIYSLYCISSHGFPDPRDFYINKKMKEFGSHFLIVKDNPKFLNLIKDKLNLLGIRFTKGFVEYYDKKIINGGITLFQKPQEFEYQKEFRIYADTFSLNPLVFKIGSLKSIAEVHETKFIDQIRLQVNSNLQI